MNLLDKHTMHYFRDEMEKQALLPAAKSLAKGVFKIVSAAGKGAAKGAAQYGKISTQIGGGPLTGALVAGLGIYGGKQAIQAASKNNQLLKSTIGGPMPRSGNLQLPQY